jgi:ribosomal protein L40E
MPKAEPKPIDERLVGFAKVGAPIAIVLGAIAAASLQGLGMALLVLAGGALVATITIFWSSVRTLIGEAPLAAADAYAMSAPRAEEEQKRAVLRALKDLEYERSVGKISEDDFRELTQKYRGRAKDLLRQLDRDREPQRAAAEALVQKRLRREGLAEAGDDEVEADPAADESAAPTSETAQQASVCGACGTSNDEDAVFCKRCGQRRHAETEEDAS